MLLLARAAYCLAPGRSPVRPQTVGIQVEKLVAIMDEMITGSALVTMEKARVLRYAAGSKAGRTTP